MRKSQANRGMEGGEGGKQRQRETVNCLDAKNNKVKEANGTRMKVKKRENKQSKCIRMNESQRKEKVKIQRRVY